MAVSFINDTDFNALTAVNGIALSGVAEVNGETITSGGSFTYKRSLTIDATLVPSTQTNFPVLVSFTDATFKTTGNGGHVENGSGYDIVFFSDSGLTTPLEFDIEFYNGTAGTIAMWVSIPSVDGTTDTVFYVAYGNSSITTSQENPAFWSALASYSGVYHLPNGSSLSAVDASGQHSAGTIHGTSATTGKIDGGAAFDGVNDDVDLGASTDWNFGTGEFTIQCWMKPANVSTDMQIIIGKDLDTARQWNLWLSLTNDGQLEFVSVVTSNTSIASTSTLSNGTWYLVHVIRDSVPHLHMYINGALDETTTDDDPSDYNLSSKIFLGKREYPGFPQWYEGALDDVRFTPGIARSADWIATEYNNQNAPATFIALGSEGPA